MGKGDNYRPVDREKYSKNFEAVFGVKPIKVWNPEEDDDAGVQGEQGDGTGNQSDSGPADGVS